MIATKTPTGRLSRRVAPLTYELSIYAYDDEDLLPPVERVIEGLGLKVESRSVRPFYMPHTGTEIYTADLVVRVPRHDAAAFLAKVRTWLESFEAVYGWDVRFEQRAERRPAAV